MTTTKLARLSFYEKLKQAEPGDRVAIYSPGISGWMWMDVRQVDWPYVRDSHGPVHHSHVHKLEKRSGEAFER